MPSMPPPPRPDPVTLDQIYDGMTAVDVTIEERAYLLVALGTVAFHPSVKLFLFEYRPLHTLPCSINQNTVEQCSGSNEDIAIAAENTRRREAVLKSIAFFLAQRNNAVAQECRWETVALLGELCRLETLTPLRSGGGVNSSRNIHDAAGGVISPQQEVVEKINFYARKNLEFLARLPWFVPAVYELTGKDTDGGAGRKETSSSSAVRRAARRGVCGADGRETNTSDNGITETDEDVRVALKDILAALPEVVTSDNTTAASAVTWSAERVEQAQDLMFLDASTTMLHLIPLVSRCSHLRCAHCEKRSSGSGELLRCSSCKAVYYCDPSCQRAHWPTAHRAPCKNYKQLADDILEQYNAMQKKQDGGGGKKKKKQQQQQQMVAVLEVPLEPSLFFTTRRYLYDHRDTSFSDVSFVDYFMKYTVRGI